MRKLILIGMMCLGVVALANTGKNESAKKWTGIYAERAELSGAERGHSNFR